MKIPKGGFAIIVRSNGKVETVINSDCKKIKPKNISDKIFKKATIAKIKPITMLDISQSPGRWYVIGGRRVWVP